jgi:hypothetical protein
MSTTLTHPMEDLPPLTPGQQLMLANFRLLDKTFWETHAVLEIASGTYNQIREAREKAHAACLAAGFGPTSYLDPND